MRVIICGDRNYSKRDVIENELKKLPKDSVIITGGATGADSIAEKIAVSLNIPVMVERADWNQYGKKAGPIRNAKMLALKPDLIVAFHDNIDKSKGTKDMIKQAKRYKVPIRLIKD
jgi:putative cell wall-binding protein